MSFDRDTRNLLANAVGKIRERLKTDVMDELRRLGFQDDGTVLDLAAIGDLTEAERAAGAELRALLEHLIAAERGAGETGAGGRGTRDIARDAYDRMAREIGFTTLNRLVALRMAEERGLIVQSAGAGPASSGFQVFERLAGGALGSRHETYRTYLECLYDEIARDLPALFDRTDPHSLIFPGERCLDDVLALLNRAELAHLWAEDETIGWVYQYYNDPDERKKMRESQAPRTSRELAVRNQFFTPRYVVEFLTDNTLGRTWYEMRQGDTRLVEQCRYMVRRKRPVFLGLLEEAPAPWKPEDGYTDPDIAGEMWTRPNPDLTEFWDILHYGMTIDYGYAHQVQGVQDASEAFFEVANRCQDAYRQSAKWQGSFEELRITLFVCQRRWAHADGGPSEEDLALLRSLNAAICRQWDLETEHIPYRVAKDPRDIKILDPACGSGHFLLYAFDLLAAIYEEGWTWSRAVPSEATGTTLRDDYPDFEVLRRATPSLILRHNLHGIDIDPRACQIAALALWLRAQRAYQDVGLKAAERPAISRGNIVCAAPMPGERNHFTRFLTALDSPTLARLAEAMWDELALAGVAGSLLKPEERLREIVKEEHVRYRAQSGGVQHALFAGYSPPTQQALDFSDVTDDGFWNAAEVRILDVLRAYSEMAENGDAATRRLFAADGTQGFRFVDLLRQRYGVVLMNPPFGDASTASAAVLERQLAESGRDIGSAFVTAAGERWAPTGLVGVLLSTRPWFQPAFRRWRLANLASPTRALAFGAQLGGDVLDGATVSASAMVISPQASDAAAIFRVQLDADKQMELEQAIDCTSAGNWPGDLFLFDLRAVTSIPGSPLAYWVSDEFRSRLSTLPPLEGSGASVRQGMVTADEFRFSYAWWEVVPSAGWLPYTKSSEYSPFWDDPSWVVKYGAAGAEIQATGRSRVQGTECFGLPGVTFPSRSVLGFNARVHPHGSGFSHTGSVAFAKDVSPAALLAYMSSRPAEYVLSFFVGSLQGEAGSHPNHYEVGVIQRLIWPHVPAHDECLLTTHATNAVQLVRSLYQIEETAHDFISPAGVNSDGLAASARAWHQEETTTIRDLLGVRGRIDEIACQLLGLSSGDIEEMDRNFRARIPPAAGRWRLYFGAEFEEEDASAVSSNVVGYALGVVFGRWDARIGKHPEWAATPGDAFGPLASCPPGMLTEDATLVGVAGPLPFRPGRIPARPEHVPTNYPIAIQWSGILVDDSELPEDDIVRSVQAVLAYLFEERAEAIEAEACEILQVKGLREYVRRPASFFAHHLSQYSKSRRQAPIYWPLSTPSCSYTLWISYHRLTSDTLFTAVNRYVLPKVSSVERDVAELGARLEAASGREATRLREEIEGRQTFREELAAFRDELLRVAALPYRPDLNDGAIINAAPLHRLFRLPKWAKDTKECWNKLERGDYDWAHLAYAIWPDRVREKCRTDKSLAIAHGLEDLYVEPAGTAVKKRRVRAPSAVATLDAEADDDE